MIKILGMLSMFFFTVSFIPQIIRLYQLKESRDISLGLCWTLTAGYTCGVFYIYPLNDLVLKVGYTAGLVFSLWTSILAVYYRRKRS